MSSLVINVGAKVTTFRGHKLTITILSNGRFGIRDAEGAFYWHATGQASSEKTASRFGNIVASTPVVTEEAAATAPRPAARQLPTVDVDGIIAKIAPACGSADKFKVKGYRLVHQLLNGRETVNALDVWAMDGISIDEKKWILQSSVGTRLLPEGAIKSWDTLVPELTAWQDVMALVVTSGHYYRCSDGKILFMKSAGEAQVLLGTDEKQYSLTVNRNGTINSRSFRVTEDLGTSYREATPQNGQVYKHIESGNIRIIFGNYLVDPATGTGDAWSRNINQYDFVGNFGIETLREHLVK